MTIEEAIRAQLTSYSGLTALIGDRALAVNINETTALPAVTFQRISTVSLHHRGGYGLQSIRFQIDGWAKTLTAAVALRAQIRAALAGYVNASSPRVDATLLQDDRDLREAEAGKYRASMDFVFWATEN